MASVPFLVSESIPTNSIPPVYYLDTLAGLGFLPEQYVDITSVFEQKREVLSRHVSQVEWMREGGGADLVDLMETMSRFRGIQCGVRYAEAFRPAHLWLRERPLRCVA